MRNRTSFLPSILLAGLILSCGQDSNPAKRAEQDRSGWHTTVEGALKASEPGPRLIVITRSGWSGYEKSTFDHPALAPVIAPLSRARLDLSDDTARFENLGIDRAPSIVLLTPQGAVISKIVGQRDISVIKRSIARAVEFPITRSELLGKSDTASQLRWIEVSIEEGDFESAAIAAKRYLGPDRSSDEAHGQYLYAYVSAELGNQTEDKKISEQHRKESKTWVDEYLKRYPAGEDASAAKWIGIVLNLQTSKPKVSEALIQDLLKSDSASAFTRQAVIAYSMEHLARAEKKLPAAIDFLTRAMADSNPWSEDFLMARATLRLAEAENIPYGIADLQQVATGRTIMSSEAQDRLVMIATAPSSQPLVPELILFFQDLAMRPDAEGAVRIRLARLYLAKGDLDRARNELKILTASDGEFADEALLFQAMLALEADRAPASAIPIFEELQKKYPDRESLWPARYGLARAYFFAGELAKADKLMADVIPYLSSRRYLPEAFLILLPQPQPPQSLAMQLADYRKKIEDIKKEEGGEMIFKELLAGVLASSKGDSSIAETSFKNVVDKHPGSTLADDAYFELAKMHLRGGDIEGAMADLNRIMTSYKGSDQFEPAQQMLAYISQYSQFMQQQMNEPPENGRPPRR